MTTDPFDDDVEDQILPDDWGDLDESQLEAPCQNCGQLNCDGWCGAMYG